MGNRRTLDQAYEFAGFDRVEHKMVGHNRCGNLKWVPFEVSNMEDWGVLETLNRRLWNEEHVMLKRVNDPSGNPWIVGSIGVSLLPLVYVIRRKGWGKRNKNEKSLQ